MCPAYQDEIAPWRAVAIGVVNPAANIHVCEAWALACQGGQSGARHIASAILVFGRGRTAQSPLVENVAKGSWFTGDCLVHGVFQRPGVAVGLPLLGILYERHGSFSCSFRMISFGSTSQPSSASSQKARRTDRACSSMSPSTASRL